MFDLCMIISIYIKNFFLTSYAGRTSYWPRTSSKNEAYISVFSEEHPGYVRGMGLGVVPTHIHGSLSSSSSRHYSSMPTYAEFNTVKETLHQFQGHMNVIV